MASDQPFSDPEWQYAIPTGTPIPLSTSWTFSFDQGVPEVKGNYTLDSLASWTTLEVPAAKVFSGTGIYQTTFELPDEILSKDMLLNLGEVREVAEVVFNGQPIDTLWSVPYQVEIPQEALQRKNELTVKVTNVSANRIAQMDREGIVWKKFYDINIVDISYKPFDASGWAPVPSGLLGQVTLQPVVQNDRP
jgi:hypothetical protein